MAATDTYLLESSEQESDQLAFYNALEEGFERAGQRTEIVNRYFEMGGFTVCLRFAGTGMLSKITRALAHLQTVAGPADFTILLFDAKSTDVQLPYTVNHLIGSIKSKWWDYLDNRRVFTQMTGSRIKTVYHVGPGILSALDLHRDRAVYWIDDTANIPYYEEGYPLTVLLNWWMTKQKKYFVHAATIGHQGNGLLLTGKGGSGKSTTTLTCLQDNMPIVGDDYAIVDPLTATAHSVYSTSKMKELPDEQIFPGLLSRVSNVDAARTGEEKAMVYLNEHYPESLLNSIKLKAILVPRIEDQTDTKFSAKSSAHALAALAPSSIFQLPGNAHAEFRAMVQLVRKLPCFEITLGRDRQQIPKAIRDFLVKL